MEFPIDKREFSFGLKRAVAISILMHGVVLALLGKTLYSTEKPALKIIPVRLLEMLKTEDASPVLSTWNSAGAGPEEIKKKPVPMKKTKAAPAKKTDAIPAIKHQKKEAAPQALPVIPAKAEGEEDVFNADPEIQYAPAQKPEALADEQANTPGEALVQDTRQAVIGQENMETQSLGQDEMLLFMSMVRDKIEKAKFYPAYAKRRGYEGSVGLTVKIAPDGGASELEVAAPASLDMLNKAAEKAVQNAVPFLPLPRGMENKEIKMKVDIVFRLG